MDKPIYYYVHLGQEVSPKVIFLFCFPPVNVKVNYEEMWYQVALRLKAYHYKDH